MTTLTRAMCTTIQNRLMHEYNGRTGAELDELETQLALDILDHALSDKKELFKSCPQEWFSIVTRVSWINGSEHDCRVKIRTVDDHDYEGVRAPAMLITGDWVFTDAVINDRYLKLLEKRRDTKQTAERLVAQIARTLPRFSTVEELETGWPEAAAALASNAGKIVLPLARGDDLVQTVHDLNTDLGLIT